MARELLGQRRRLPVVVGRAAMNRSLTYAQSHPDEIRALLPAATRNIRLATWSPLIDRAQILTLARIPKEHGVISTLPNFTTFVPNFIEGGRTLQATVGERAFLTLRLDGKKVETLKAGKYNVAVADKPTMDNFHLKGAGIDRSTSVKRKQTVAWTLTLRKGGYRFSFDGSTKRRGSFRVTSWRSGKRRVSAGPAIPVPMGRVVGGKVGTCRP